MSDKYKRYNMSDEDEKDYMFLLDKICNRALHIHNGSYPIPSPYTPPKRNLLYFIKRFFWLLSV
jgi:hypothetical protein